jgi:hypothetical protein
LPAARRFRATSTMIVAAMRMNRARHH